MEGGRRSQWEGGTRRWELACSVDGEISELNIGRSVVTAATKYGGQSMGKLSI